MGLLRDYCVSFIWRDWGTHSQAEQVQGQDSFLLNTIWTFTHEIWEKFVLWTFDLSTSQVLYISMLKAELMSEHWVLQAYWFWFCEQELCRSNGTNCSCTCNYEWGLTNGETTHISWCRGTGCAAACNLKTVCGSSGVSPWSWGDSNINRTAACKSISLLFAFF